MSTPHRCPVCNGVGKVQYDPDNPFMGMGTNAGPWPCKPCLGTGVLWEFAGYTIQVVSEPSPKPQYTWNPQVVGSGTLSS